MNARILTVSILLLATASASAQGYLVRTGGYYDRFPYPPAIGGTWSYSPYRPMVTVYDPWGRVAAMPLQPKVLYYGASFLTPQGWHQPTSITVMPDPYPRAYRVPTRVLEVIPPARSVPEATPPRPAAKPIPPGLPLPADANTEPPQAPPKAGLPTVPAPETVPVRPAAKPIPPRLPVPANANPEPPRAAPKAGLPPVPDVPKLPDLPQIPGTAPDVPKLGPAPTDLPPVGRPPR
jgi:hypothetical protein